MWLCFQYIVSTFFFFQKTSGKSNFKRCNNFAYFWHFQELIRVPLFLQVTSISTTFFKKKFLHVLQVTHPFKNSQLYINFRDIYCFCTLHLLFPLFFQAVLPRARCYNRLYLTVNGQCNVFILFSYLQTIRSYRSKICFHVKFAKFLRKPIS